MRLAPTKPKGEPNRDAWRTPKALFERLDRIFHFVCDCAATPDNALCEMFITPEQNALTTPWPRAAQGWCWLNPPFSMLDRFLPRVHGQVVSGSDVVVLMPAHRVEQRWWHDHVLGVASILVYPEGRVEYEPPPGAVVSGPTFPSVIAMFAHDLLEEPATAAVSLDELEDDLRRDGRRP